MWKKFRLWLLNRDIEALALHVLSLQDELREAKQRHRQLVDQRFHMENEEERWISNL